jgi:hypothetical protein
MKKHFAVQHGSASRDEPNGSASTFFTPKMLTLQQTKEEEEDDDDDEEEEEDLGKKHELSSAFKKKACINTIKKY